MVPFFRCKETERIATLPVGYADGYSRTLTGKGTVTTKEGNMSFFYQTYISNDQLCLATFSPSGVGGGGGTLIFFAYVGSDPASTVHPKKISGISSTPKKYLKFWQPPKISQLCTLILKKDPKLHRNDPQTSPIL